MKEITREVKDFFLRVIKEMIEEVKSVIRDIIKVKDGIKVFF